MGNIVKGQSPIPGEPGRFINKQSLPGRKVTFAAQALGSGFASVPLAIGGTSSGAVLDTGYISANLNAYQDGKLIEFFDLLPLAWANFFTHFEGDFDFELLQGPALPDNERRITVGQYWPFTPGGHSAQVIYNFHNYGAASTTVYGQSFWKVLLIGDPQ